MKAARIGASARHFGRRRSRRAVRAAPPSPSAPVAGCARWRAPRRASPPQVRARPHRARRGVHRRHQRPAHFHRVVQPRRVGPAVVHVVAVVDDVDAADEGHPLVAHAQLLVQAAQLARLQPRVPAVERAEHLQPHAAAGEHLAQAGQRGDAAEAVHHHVHAHAARRRAIERLGNGAGRGIVVEDVGGQPDLAGGGIDGLAHAREKARRRPPAARPGCRRRSAAPVRWSSCAGGRGRRRARRAQPGSSSATSGRWSDMRAQAVPRGTIVERQAQAAQVEAVEREHRRQRRERWPCECARHRAPRRAAGRARASGRPGARPSR